MRNCASAYFVTLPPVSPRQSPKLLEENDVFEALSAAGSNKSLLNDVLDGMRIRKMSYSVGLKEGKTQKWRRQKYVKTMILVRLS